MDISKLTEKLEQVGYTVDQETIDENLYSFYIIKGKNIFAGFCTPHDGMHKNASYSYINGKISADNSKCFDKWRKCPVILPLPSNDAQLDFLIKELQYLGSNEGYKKSNEYDYNFVYGYPTVQ